MTFILKLFNYSIVNVHEPTEENGNVEKETFYEELEKIVQCQKWCENSNKWLSTNMGKKMNIGQLYKNTAFTKSLMKTELDKSF